MTASYTPGPWSATYDGVWAKTPWNANVRLATITHPSPMNGIDGGANARLICAAPDMLEALQGVRASTEWSCMERDAQDAVRAAIAKATGADQ